MKAKLKHFFPLVAVTPQSPKYMTSVRNQCERTSYKPNSQKMQNINAIQFHWTQIKHNNDLATSKLLKDL